MKNAQNESRKAFRFELSPFSFFFELKAKRPKQEAKMKNAQNESRKAFRFELSPLSFF